MNLQRLGIVLLVLALASCGGGVSEEAQRAAQAPIEVDTELDPEANMANYKTWNWIPVPVGKSGDPRIDSQQFRNNVGNAVEREMFEHGYRRSETNPDLLLNGHAAVADVDANYIETHYGGQYPDYKVDTDDPNKGSLTWEEGSLIIFIFDAKTRAMVYRGSARAEVVEDMPEEMRTDRLNKAIKMIFEKFPKRTS